jgi:hypothetical protein
VKYIRHDNNGFHLDGYLIYLDAVRSKIPHNAAQYAFAPWRYRMDDHQCPHDSWLNELRINDKFEPVTRKRTLELRGEFRGAFHDLFFEIVWQGVQAYSLTLESAVKGKHPVGHADWMIDELLVEESGLLTHEIEFSDSGLWTISCADLVYTKLDIPR